MRITKSENATLGTGEMNVDLIKANNALLYIIHSLGGSCSIQRLYLIMYLADQKHAVKYGVSITGDRYTMVDGMLVPEKINEYLLYHDAPANDAMLRSRMRHAITVSNDEVSATARYSASFIAGTEVQCMFETVQQNKHTTEEALWGRVRTLGQFEGHLTI